MSKIKIKKITVTELILGTYFLLAPFGVSDAINSLIPGLGLSLTMIGVIFIFFLLYFMKGNPIKLDRFEVNTILLFIIPIMLSFLGIFISLFTINNVEYIQYITENLPTRLLLIMANITIIVGLLSITDNWRFERIRNLIKKYYYGVLIFATVGVWQFIHFLLGIPYLDIQTRSHIHSVDRARTFFINGRLTSFAAEPSYLAPIVIDLMIISFLVSKKPMRPFLIGLFVLIFSYSGGGYLNLFILIPFFIIGYLKYKGYKLQKKHARIIAISFVVGVLTVIKYKAEIYDLAYPVLGRLDTLFDINKHSRMFMIFMPFSWVLEGNIISALFGYGPKSYSYLRLTKFLPSGRSVHVTSNNLFADTVFELGYVGFVSYVAMFGRFILISFKKIYNNKSYFIAMMLSVHIVATSIYRADFMQSRFWVLIFIILKLMEEGARRWIDYEK